MVHPPIPNTLQNARHAAGFTLIETCAVVSIIAVVAATAMPSLQALVDARRLDGVASELVSDIQLARSEAVARNLPVRWTLQTTADGSCYLIHTGNAGDCTCTGSAPAVCTGSALAIKSTTVRTADRIGMASKARSILFDPLHGTCTPAATVRVLGTADKEVDQVINVMGRVRSCSPHGTVAGYRAC